MRKILSLICCFAIVPVFAQNAIPFCTSMATRVNVRTPFCHPHYNSQYSRIEFVKKTNTLLSADTTMGLTHGELGVKLQVKPSVEEKVGQICVGLQEVTVEFECPELTVYIDKKYATSSCEYKVIKEHENYHVAVFQQAQKFYKKDIEEAVYKAIERLSPKIVYTNKEVQPVVKKMHASVVNALKPLLQHINKKVQEKNAAIDTPEMYKETAAKCKNW